MYIINASHFNGKLSIDNINESNNAISEEVELYVDEKVRLLLQNVLGVVLFAEFNGYVVNGVLPNTAPQKWKDLVDGKTYTKDDKTYKWNGLIYSEGLMKKSLLADFVYHEWRTDKLLKDVVIDPKNATVTNQNSFLVDVWNGFLNQYQDGYSECFVKANLITRDCIEIENHYKDNVSLLRFLKDKETDYPNAKLYVFPNATYSNSLGI